jgi:hypothetical protein
VVRVDDLNTTVPVDAADTPAVVALEVNRSPVTLPVSASVTTPSVTVSVEENVAATATVAVFAPLPIMTAFAPDAAAKVRVVDAPVTDAATRDANVPTPALVTFQVLDVPRMSYPVPACVMAMADPDAPDWVTVTVKAALEVAAPASLMVKVVPPVENVWSAPKICSQLGTGPLVFPAAPRIVVLLNEENTSCPELLM